MASSSSSQSAAQTQDEHVEGSGKAGGSLTMESLASDAVGDGKRWGDASTTAAPQAQAIRPGQRRTGRRARRRAGAPESTRGDRSKNRAPKITQLWRHASLAFRRCANTAEPALRYAHVVQHCAHLEPALRSNRGSLLPHSAARRAEIGGGTAAATDTTDWAMPHSFALVREAARRELGLRHFDVQLLCGAVLYEGAVAEMRTGEGKTLAAVLPAALASFSGTSVNIVTVNEYLARRDAQKMGRVFEALGISVGFVDESTKTHEKRAAYKCDVTYSTNHQLGFDYLRDHTTSSAEDFVLSQGLGFAIIDEVDSILIDESSNPLLMSISPPGEEDELVEGRGNFFEESGETPAGRDVVERFAMATRIAEELTAGEHYTVWKVDRSVYLREQGALRAEEIVGAPIWLEDARSATIPWGQCISVALQAKHFYLRDVDYVVRGGKLVLIDQSTGRAEPLRKYGELMHQAIEAKERLAMSSISINIAEITFQCFYKLFEKVSGMTGTADTEAKEFLSVYDLEVVKIPTHRPSQMRDLGVVAFMNQDVKFGRIAGWCWQLQSEGRPVLVGLESIEDSERLSEILTSDGVQHTVLNARPERGAMEAEIVAQAGRPGAITVATNMAGRGTDIILGGNAPLLCRSRMRREALEAVQEFMSAASIVDGGLTRSDLDELRRFSHDMLVTLLPEEYLPGVSLASKQLIASMRAAIVCELRAACGAPKATSSTVPTTHADGPGRPESSAFNADNAPVDVTEPVSNGNGALEYEQGPGPVDEAKRLWQLLDTVCDDAESILRSEGFEAATQRPDLWQPRRSTPAGEGSVRESMKLPTMMVLLEYTHDCERQRERALNEGGLMVIVGQPHSSRRIDNQLRGRAGRQGDPGACVAVASLDDKLFVQTGIQGSATAIELLRRLGIGPDGDQPVAGIGPKFLANLQDACEKSMRKNRKSTYEYDNVLDVHRRHLYTLRDEILLGDAAAVRKQSQRFMLSVLDEVLATSIDSDCHPDSWRADRLLEGLAPMFPVVHLTNMLTDSGGSVQLQNVLECVAEGRWPEDTRMSLSMIGIEAKALVEKRKMERTGNPLFPSGRHAAAAEALREFLHEYFVCEYDSYYKCVERCVRGGLAIQGEEVDDMEKRILIHNLTEFWTAHINRMRFTKRSCQARSFGGLNPLEEYTLASSRSFTKHMQAMRRMVVTDLWMAMLSAEKRWAGPFASR